MEDDRFSMAILLANIAKHGFLPSRQEHQAIEHEEHKFPYMKNFKIITAKQGTVPVEGEVRCDSVFSTSFTLQSFAACLLIK